MSTVITDDTLNGLLRAIIMSPEEDTPRLIYADRLDELGESERAEFVRIFVELHVEPEPDHAPVDCQVYNSGSCPYHTKVDRGVYLLNRLYRDVWGSLNFGWERGFANHWVVDADTFLLHAGALIWNETQVVTGVDRCPKCDGSGRMGRVRCVACDGVSTVTTQSPRPCPPTAQPIRRVVLTTGEWGTLVHTLELYVMGDATYHSRKYLGIEFELPGGTEAASEEEWNDHEVWGGGPIAGNTTS